MTVVNIFTNRKNNTNSFPNIQIYSPMYTSIQNIIYTHRHISQSGKPVSKLKSLTNILIHIIMQTVKNSMQFSPERTTFTEE